MQERDPQRRAVTVRPAVRHLPSRPPSAVASVPMRVAAQSSVLSAPATGVAGSGSTSGAANGARASVAPPPGLFGRPRPPVPAMAEIPPGLGTRADAARTAAQIGIRALPASSVRAVYAPAVAARAFNVPNLRRNVCPHFYVTGPRGALPVQAPHLLKALIRQESNVSRCQLRGGVHLEQGYINDVCMTPRFNQCVFYEDGLGDR